MADEPTPLKLSVAESPARQAMLDLLDKARAEVEAGTTQCLVLIPMFGGGDFAIRSAGDVGSLRLAAVLGRAWLDANKLMEK